MADKLLTKDKLFKEVTRLSKRNDWPLELVSMVNRRINTSWTQWLKFSGSHTFIDRSKGSKKLLIVLAGYKSFLWPLTLNRLTKFVPADLDVCIVSSGLYSAHLDEWAASQGWSYLYTKNNKVALGQNLAIAKHTQAQWIYKLDEDIFISENFFELLLKGYLRIKEEGLYNPGFCAPLININGYSYIKFLKIMNAEAEYKAKFNELKHAANWIKAQNNGEAARWLWEKSLPFDQVAQHVMSENFGYSAVPHRFSIGAILFERELWESIGGFKVPLTEGVLGIDEEYLCKECIEMSRVMLVIHNVFAGHFAFGTQEDAMKEYLPEIYSKLAVTGELVGSLAR